MSLDYVINDFNGDDIIINRACVSPIHDDFQLLHHGENLFYSELLIFFIPTCIKLGHPSCKIKNFKSRGGTCMDYGLVYFKIQ